MPEGAGEGRENPFRIDRTYVERIFGVNVFAAWRLCLLAVPYMAESGYESIVNITSMASIDRSPDMSVYASSKAALNHMTANLAYDFGSMNVRINCVGPGATRTHALESVLTPELEEKMLRHTPLKRLGEVSDIAGAVLYFAHPFRHGSADRCSLSMAGACRHSIGFRFRRQRGRPFNTNALLWIIME